MGQPSKDLTLPEERLASEEISEGRREECTIPSTGRMAQNPLYKSALYFLFKVKKLTADREENYTKRQ
jgi:hypothetical protein